MTWRYVMFYTKFYCRTTMLNALYSIKNWIRFITPCDIVCWISWKHSFKGYPDDNTVKEIKNTWVAAKNLTRVLYTCTYEYINLFFSPGRKEELLAVYYFRGEQTKYPFTARDYIPVYIHALGCCARTIAFKNKADVVNAQTACRTVKMAEGIICKSAGSPGWLMQKARPEMHSRGWIGTGMRACADREDTGAADFH